MEDNWLWSLVSTCAHTGELTYTHKYTHACKAYKTQSHKKIKLTKQRTLVLFTEVLLDLEQCVCTQEVIKKLHECGEELCNTASVCLTFPPLSLQMWNRFPRNLSLLSLLKLECLWASSRGEQKPPSQKALCSHFSQQLIPLWFGKADHSLWEIPKVEKKNPCR